VGRPGGFEDFSVGDFFFFSFSSGSLLVLGGFKRALRGRVRVARGVIT
jgi:hypothetical protein